MQGKEKNIGKLADQGWKDMSAILDRDIPVKRNRKPVAWVLIAGALLVAALTWTLTGQGELDANKSIVPTERQVAPMADNTPEIEAEENKNSHVVEQHTPDHQGPAEKQPTYSQFPVVITEVGPEKSRSVASENDVPETAIEQDRRSNETAVRANTQSGDGESIVDGLNEENTDLAEVQSESRERAIDVDPVQPIQSSGIALLEPPVAVMPTAGYEVVKKSKLGLHVFGAPHFDEAIRVNGLEAGLLVGYDVASRWSVRAGVSYGYYEENGLVDLDFSKSMDRASQEIDLTPVLDPGSTYPQLDINELVSYDTAQVLTNKLSYIHVPLHVEYRLTKNLGVIVGAKFSWLLSAPVENGVRGTSFSGSAGSMDLNNVGNFLIDFDVLKRFDWAPSAGISWRAGRKFAFDVQYFHGMIPYIDRSEVANRSDYNRSLSLGVRYRVL